MGERTRVGISADRIIALIVALIMVGTGFELILTGDWLNVLIGIISMVLGVLLILLLNVFKVEALDKLPYGVWVLALFSVILVLLCLLWLNSFILAAILMICATLINVLSEKQSYAPSKLVVLAGAGLAIYESALLFLSQDIVNIVFGIIGIILAVMLILSLSKKINIPYAWWVVLIIGAIFYAIMSNFFGFGDACGIIVLTGFILIVFAY
ncbi:MAG: hypothetical protein EU547_03425 [Promethearchaeota archaeon]|nr:MAG: hypothetical protein EU547_03425 [Candidatus Lokiarchaeota archaeon]